MKWFLLTILWCNAVLFDAIYKEIIIQAIVTHDIHQKNLSIETLRKLCDGQRSTYEIGKPWRTR